MVKLVEIALLKEAFLVEIPRNERLQLPSAGVDPPQILGKSSRKLFFLHQHLAITENMIDGSAQLMPHPGEIDVLRRRDGFGCAVRGDHAKPLHRSSSLATHRFGRLRSWGKGRGGAGSLAQESLNFAEQTRQLDRFGIV